MKRPFIAVVIALTSTAAFAQGSPAAGTVQSLTASGQSQTQTTTPSSNVKPSAGSKVEGANSQPAEWRWIDSWSQLGQGWKQFDPKAGK
jgi:hypothetical protein